MKIRATAVVAGLAVVTLGGCAFTADKGFRDEHTLAGGIAAVTIDGGAGSATISASSTDGLIHVKRHVQYRDRKPGATDSVAGDTLTLKTSCGRTCWVDYEVTAPKGIRVAGRNGSGNVNLNGVASASIVVGSGELRVRGASGDVTARAGSGDIEVSDAAGSVAARTGSGDIRLTGVTGTATAETGSGNITGGDLRGSRTSTHTGSGDVVLTLAATQDIDAETGSGNVRLTVPAGQKYRVAASTSSGNSHVDVPTDPAADHQLKLKTGSGNIMVNER